ncbi:Clavaminate synthase-like protein [Corynespora cassiicola Philippines]|uniref:Clavaminate synthase-like protein n=1 Tax=Corynespora cassiicola Philippines TaxID=1448308 RepID=A0A2T2NGX3_CORCC|nr:Clavaminate synthase-like protein [Corynespora cassiicola Philippines]
MLLHSPISPSHETPNHLWNQSPGAFFHLGGKPVEDCPRPVWDSPKLAALKDFPRKLLGGLCRDGRALSGDTSTYIVTLSDDDIRNVEAALNSFKTLGLEPNMLGPATSPLSTELGYRLRAVSTILHECTGFAVLRGLDSKRYSDDDNLIIFAGPVSWIGSERATNPLGMSTEHIRDAVLDGKPEGVDNSELDPAKQPHMMNFHAERFMADILALHVRKKAVSGGEQYIASFPIIYNELMETDPEVLGILAKDWDWPPPPEDIHSDPIKGPIIFSNGERVIAQLVWAPFVENPVYMTPERERALTAVNELAKKLCVKLDSQVGDIQLFNNLAMIHARNGF